MNDGIQVGELSSLQAIQEYSRTQNILKVQADKIVPLVIRAQGVDQEQFIVTSGIEFSHKVSPDKARCAGYDGSLIHAHPQLFRKPSKSFQWCWSWTALRPCPPEPLCRRSLRPLRGRSHNEPSPCPLPIPVARSAR